MARRVLGLLTALLILGGCAARGVPAEPESPAPPEASEPAAVPSEEPEPSATAEPSVTPEPSAEPPEENDTAARLCAEMSTAEKVWQLFVLYPSEVTEEREVGGVVFSGADITTPEATMARIEDFGSRLRVAPFIMVDEEGGRVSRLGANPDMPVTYYPAMGEIGAAGDPEKARACGAELGRQLLECGFNVDFAPCADVVTNPENTAIGDRSFSGDPEIAAEMVAAYVEAMQAEGVSSTLKHFPGHGSTGPDPHEGFTSIERGREDFESTELVPFRAGIAAGADFVMVGHFTAANLTGSEEPCSLNRYTMTQLLRGELGFGGVVITDALNMGAVTSYASSGEAAVLALEAGADMLLEPEDVNEAYSAVLAALDSGRLSMERIDESVTRILALKLERGVITAPEV